ncbi:MAG: patatin-like phospholipase family protein [Gemmatimonadaceae bacterium]
MPSIWRVLTHCVAKAGLLSLIATQAAAQENYCIADGKQLPTVLTVEGGGSLGVYEAGMTYALIETFKRKRDTATNKTALMKKLDAYCLTSATGASAGNINSFLASVTWCDLRLTEAPEESVFWLAWITTGINELSTKHAHDSLKKEGGLFTRQHFRGHLETELKARWRSTRWLDRCYVDFGATVTRLTHDTVPGAGTITARNQRIALVFRIRGMQTDGTPKMRQFVPDTAQFNFASFKTTPALDSTLDTIPSRGPDSISYAHQIRWEDAFRLVETSSGFPVAFQPQHVKYCTRFRFSHPADEFPHACAQHDSALALDGGVFDNGPIALAYSLYFQAWRNAGVPFAIYLSPDRRRLWVRDSLKWTKRQVAAGSRFPPYGLENITQLITEAYPTARQYELQLAGRLLPNEVHRRIAVTQQGAARSERAGAVTPLTDAVEVINAKFRSTERSHPLAGDWVGGFGAFLGRPLREYDFYVGIYDAFVLLTENVQCNSWRLKHSGYRKLETDDPLRTSANDSLRACMKDSLRLYIDNPPIPLGKLAPVILEELYNDEFVGRVPANSASADSAITTASAVRFAMSRSEDANGFRDDHCRPVGLFEAPFCGSGTIKFFDALWSEKRAVDILKTWRKSDACDEKNAKASHHLCRAERSFVAAIGDPEGRMHDMTADLLARLEDVTPRGAASRRAASALLIMQGTVGDKHRRGWDLGPSSLPRNLRSGSRVFLSLLPSSVGLTPATAGYGVHGWELRYNVGTSRTAISLPVSYRPRSSIGRYRGQNRDLVVAGLRLEDKAVFGRIRSGVQVNSWYRTRPWFDERRSGYSGATVGLFASLYGKINITWEGAPQDLDFYQDRAWRPFGMSNPTVLTIGLGDFNGLLYWGDQLALPVTAMPRKLARWIKHL